ncbi:FAD-dependent oxidoreductase [Litoribrevibacter euphylliae]|uniref:FAD-dependent oxidoreductase n=1 Tax=Litoribrevibacter euphylliae TaxID=1834034 RepID=A0ABV7HAY9_9GAMM
MTKHLVLVGGGHSHALLLKKLVRAPIRDLEVTLISPGRFAPYSGMLPGFISGHYDFQDIHIDLIKLAQCSRCQFIESRANALNPKKQQLLLENDQWISYDLLSFDTGATPDLSVPGSAEYTIPVKPIEQFHSRWTKLLKDIQESNPSSPFTLSIIGSGAAGIELALAIDYKLKRDIERPVSIQLLSRTKDILTGYPTRLQRYIHKRFAEAGIRILQDCDVSRVTATQLFTKDGEIIDSSAHLWCTQVTGAEWLTDTQLSLSQAGFIEVRPTLQTLSYDSIFAVGDVAHLIHQPLPKAGVYAVRMADTLYTNLKAVSENTTLSDYQPQQDFLSLLACGDRTAVGCKHGLTIKGRWVWRMKDKIDRDFMNQFKAL